MKQTQYPKSLIQEKEKDEEYKHLFYDGAEINKDEILFEYYDPRAVYIVSKAESVPDDLYTTLNTLTKTNIDKDTTIGEDDIIPFEIPEPEDEQPDIPDFEIPEPPDPTIKTDVIKIPEPPTIIPRKKPKFNIHTSLTLISMLNGTLINGIDENIEIDEVKTVIIEWIKKEKQFKNVLKDIDDKENLEVQLFLPCGAPFLSGTYKEWENSIDSTLTKTLYAVVTRKLGHLKYEIIENVCDCSSKKMKLILSPLFDSTKEGYTQIASLLGYFYYGGSLSTSENLLRNLATMAGFVPMINLIYTIMIHKKINGMMIASITAPLQTFIREKVIDSDNNTAFSFTISLMSYVKSQKIVNLPTPNLITYGIEKDEKDDDLNDAQKYIKKNEKFNFIVLWDKDFESNNFKVTKKPKPVNIEKLNENLKEEMSFKPFSPMTILYLHSVSFIRTTKSKKKSNPKVGLFIRKKPIKDKQRNIVFIDPEEGELKEIDYEDLAEQINDHSVDENIQNKGDTSLQQIIYICLDVSNSMRNLLNNLSKKMRSKQPSKKQISVIFLKHLMKRIHDYKVPTARGLILFGEEIKIACPLSITEKSFDDAVQNIFANGSTPLWEAVNLAADEIIKFNTYEKSDDDDDDDDKEEKHYKYPEAKGRIILLSDVNDTELKSNQDKKSSIIEKLVKNGIVMDFIMVSTVDECFDVMTAAKITGGLSFRPKNEEEGVEIFETEAFLDINARSNCIPIENKITEDSFKNILKLIENNPYTNPNEIKNKFIKQATLNAELSSVDYTLFYRKDERYQPKAICERYIIKQLNRIKKQKDPNIVVYTFQQELKKWRVFIKAPDGTPYENKWWNLYVNFKSNYPNSPPQFRFISVPYHQNVSPEGLLLFTKIADGFEPNDKMVDVLIKIRDLFENPDDSFCLRESLLDERTKDNEAFVRKANASTEAFAKDDYHEFLAGCPKVNEDIPESGIVDDIDDENNDDSIFVSFQDRDGTFRRKLISDFNDEDDNLYD